mmetsp:Transcript_13547/g.43340  ORF Transcript_13547/g.43340 Transcript_13547/m.43340 type:complete len:217 (-) Transcript_13547:18-668(-)
MQWQGKAEVPPPQQRAAARWSPISVSMACMIGSREASECEGSSSAGGSFPPPPPPEPAVAEATGASVSTRFSSSWCSRENPCDGSRPATSIVERCETPTSTRRAQQSGSIVRPATRKRRPVGGTARPRRSGATHPSQKERTVVEPGQYTLRGGLSGSESRTKSSSVSDPPAAEGAAAVDVDGPASPLLPKKGRLAAILAAERAQGLLEPGRAPTTL